MLAEAVVANDREVPSAGATISAVSMARGYWLASSTSAVNSGALRPPVAQALGLLAAQRREPRAGARTADHTIDRDDRFTMAYEHETGHSARRYLAGGCLLFVRDRTIRAPAGRRFFAVATGSRLTIRTKGPDPRSAGLLADAHALGLGEVTGIDVADVVFFDDELAPADREPPGGRARRPPAAERHLDRTEGGIDTELLPGVTDPAAAAVALAIRTIGDIPEMTIATGKHYDVHGDLGPDTIATIARRLLANQVIERWAPAPLTPSFVDTHATAERTVDHVAIRTLDDEAARAQQGARPVDGPRRAARRRRVLPRHRPRTHRRGAGDTCPDVERALRAQDVPGPHHGGPTTAPRSRP